MLQRRIFTSTPLNATGPAVIELLAIVRLVGICLMLQSAQMPDYLGEGHDLGNVLYAGISYTAAKVQKGFDIRTRSPRRCVG